MPIFCSINQKNRSRRPCGWFISASSFSPVAVRQSMKLSPRPFSKGRKRISRRRVVNPSTRKAHCIKLESYIMGLRPRYLSLTISDYSSMSITRPEPTVRPPSRIAKRRPFSIAIGVMSSTFISTWSPGMHISTPSGSLTTPVTSVVLK